MNILTVDNKTYNIDTVPDEIDDIRFCVLDFNDTSNIDYFFLPLVFLESFYAPAMVLKIADRQIKIPLDWSIMVCDSEMTDVEIMPLTSLNDRGFKSLLFNPLSDYSPSASDISIMDVYAEVKWFFPKIKAGCMLAIPIESGDNPRCAYFVKEHTKLPKTIDIGDLF